MNSKIRLQQFKNLLFVPSLLVLVLAVADAASAVQLKNTNYRVPHNAYFVSPNGKENNSGRSPRSPWSVHKALRAAPRGATIVFRGGQYRNIKARITKKLTLQPYPHEIAWLKGSVEVTGWVREGDKWRKDGWKQSFPSIDKVYVDPDKPMAGHTDMVYINGVSLKQVGSKAKVVQGTFYVDNANNKLYIGSNPADKTVEATARDIGFSLMKSSASGTVVRGLGFAHYAGKALFVGADNIKLENNAFVWNGFSGVSFVGGKNAVVSGNTFSYNGRVGLAGEADGILLEGNTISYNNVEHFRKTWAAAGVKLIKTSGSVLRNNIVENNFATGIWFDASSMNTTIVNNTSRNNESIGIQFELSHRALIARNIVFNNNAGVMVADSSGVQIYNNRMWGNRNNVVIKDSPRVNRNPAEIARGITWITRNNIVRNNSLN